ncbi:hypothetical protein HGRIS_005391 [Hohenbuehelia grisea]|uniref:Uncharacterized protein n=1 Tax=Hohenbuehelia grisea TaxID=104357 RepID=A0ABR3JFX4_9AGAR
MQHTSLIRSQREYWHQAHIGDDVHGVKSLQSSLLHVYVDPSFAVSGFACYAGEGASPALVSAVLQYQARPRSRVQCQPTPYSVLDRRLLRRHAKQRQYTAILPSHPLDLPRKLIYTLRELAQHT